MEINLDLLQIQNPWWDYKFSSSGEYNFNFDPVLSEYENHVLKWKPKILDEIDFEKDSIYILEGARAVGKTTILKLLIKKLIKKDKIKPNNIFYYSCHNLETNEQLNELIKVFLSSLKNFKKERRYIFIDEITLIKNWDKGMSYLAGAGKFKNISVVLAGSVLGEFKLKAPGLKIDSKIISSLSFKDFTRLINPELFGKINKNNYLKFESKLEYYVDIYFLTGGFISCLNSFAENGAIRQNVYSNYLYWLIADIAKLKRDTGLMRQTVEQIILNLGRTIGYKTIAKKTKAKTHLTTAEYLKILESMFAVKMVYQLNERGEPDTRKSKKVYFRDPFLFWLFYSYIHGSIDYWRLSRERLHRADVYHFLTETAVFSQLIKSGDGKNKYVSFWRDRTGKKEINFIAGRKKNNMPILIERDSINSARAEKIFNQAGFKRGIVISRKKLDLTNNIKIAPLSYFLLFYKDLINFVETSEVYDFIKS